MSAVFSPVLHPHGRRSIHRRHASKFGAAPVVRFAPSARRAQETDNSAPAPSRDESHSGCVTAPAAWSAAEGSIWSSGRAERVDAKSRLAKLAKALESDVIPRLVVAHGKEPRAAFTLETREIEQFVNLLRNGSDADVSAKLSALRGLGLTVDAMFLDLFAPAARHLGALWDADRCDFSTVTICLGRLQRLLREWSPAFGIEVAHPPNARRILLAQHPEEQHSFGLSMVGEFFRRAGWEVLGGVGNAAPDPSAQVSREWFDAVGFSIGSESRVDWLKERIDRVRKSTRNRSILVLVGGPLFVMQPAWAHSVGADASSNDGGKAPTLAEDLLAARFAQR